jgi:hypothetical protein
MMPRGFSWTRVGPRNARQTDLGVRHNYEPDDRSDAHRCYHHALSSSDFSIGEITRTLAPRVMMIYSDRYCSIFLLSPDFIFLLIKFLSIRIKSSCGNQ